MNNLLHTIMPSINPSLILVSVLGTAVLFIVSLWGKRRGYYEKGNFWFDDIMHFSGGFLVAMFCSAFIQYWPLILSLTFLVGVLWETQEYFRGIYKFKKYGTKEDMTETRDSIEDLICDIAGSVAWMLILKNLIGR